MKWQITLFGLLLCGFFSFFGFSLQTYAVSDYSITLDWDNLSSFYICGGDSGRSCSDYNYFISEPANSCFDGAAAFYASGFNGFRGNSIISICSTILIPLSNTSDIFLTGGRNLVSRYSGDFTLTLSSSLGTSCPEPEPCPVVPDTPYGDKFDNIEKAIYVCGAILIMLYFFYCIYRMIIKGSGVN